MNKEVISNFEGMSLLIMFIAGTALAFPTGLAAGSDLWIAIILAVVFSVPVYLVYARLQFLFPQQDLFQILEVLFGRFIGKAIGLLFIWFAFHIGTLLILSSGEFLITVSLPETPKVVPMIFMTLLSIWIVKEGIEVMGRWARFFFVINALVPTTAVIMLIPRMDIDNIKPILYNGIKPLLEGTLQAFTFPFGEVVVFLMALFFLRSEKSYFKVYITSLLTVSIMLVSVSLAEVLVLGSDLYSATYIPNHTVASKIEIGNFIQRLEVVVIVAMYTASFVKLSICLLATSNGFAKVFGFKDYRFIVAPVALLMFNNSFIMYGNLMELAKFDMEVWSYYALPFQLIMPLVILGFAEINRVRRLKKDKVSR